MHASSVMKAHIDRLILIKHLQPVMESMFEVGAFPDSSQSWRLAHGSCDEKERLQMLNALSRHGLVREVVLGEYESKWQLSMLAMTILRPTITLKEPKHFFIAREGTPIEEWSALECAVMLHMEGWSHKMLDTGEKMTTANYMGGNENRVWLSRAGQKALAWPYLQVLYMASTNFAHVHSSVREQGIPHGKSGLVYTALFEGKSWRDAILTNRIANSVTMRSKEGEEVHVVFKTGNPQLTDADDQDNCEQIVTRKRGRGMAGGGPRSKGTGTGATGRKRGRRERRSQPGPHRSPSDSGIEASAFAQQAALPCQQWSTPS